ncbi:MAG: glutamine amidotransferase [Chlorobiaceae bacterium]|nr:glutamine amidotransferase [Chlorobiaceae bacterium]
MKKLYILKTGTTFSSTLERLGDFEEWIIAGLGDGALPLEVINVVKGDPLPALSGCLGVFVTGSHAMVTDSLSWSLEIEGWIPSLVKERIPFLGICYGHQLLGRAMRGMVDYHPLGSEVGTVDIMLTEAAFEDPLFKGFPEQFSAHATHAQTVIMLPPESVLLASSDHDPHQAFRIGACAWGVQFHPEYNTGVMKADIEEQAESLEKSGRNVADLLENVKETLFAAKVIVNFAEFCSSYRS